MKVYRINALGHLNTYHVVKDNGNGVAYLSEWSKTDITKAFLINSKSIHGTNPTYYKTKEEALTAYTAHRMSEIEFATTNLKKDN